MKIFGLRNTWLLLIACALLTGAAYSQNGSPNTQQQNVSSTTIEGTVVSSSRQTLVVKTDDNDYYLFVFDSGTNKPARIIVGNHVRVVSTPGEESGTRLASAVTAVDSAPVAKTGTIETQAAAPPAEVRNVEQNIKSEARRWHLGVRAGAALDPELFMFGVHSQIGPIFSRNVFFRPNAEFAFGEVTDLIALNLEAIYRLPISANGKTWSAYLGAGPAFTFLHQNFETQQGQGRDIDFGNFDYETGFNILAGIQRRHTFYELKTSLYSRPAPTLRLIIGYTF